MKIAGMSFVYINIKLGKMQDSLAQPTFEPSGSHQALS
jgi:hypothetical protein